MKTFRAVCSCHYDHKGKHIITYECYFHVHGFSMSTSPWWSAQVDSFSLSLFLCPLGWLCLSPLLILFLLPGDSTISWTFRILFQILHNTQFCSVFDYFKKLNISFPLSRNFFQVLFSTVYGKEWWCYLNCSKHQGDCFHKKKRKKKWIKI